MPSLHLWFEPTNNSLLSEQAAQTDNSNLPLHSKQATMLLSSEQATQTAGKLLLRLITLTTPIPITNCLFEPIKIQTDDSSKSIVIQTLGKLSSFPIDDCSLSPSLIIQTDSSVDLPLQLTAITEATAAIAPSSTVVGPQ
jgi:hypothetical protein